MKFKIGDRVAVMPEKYNPDEKTEIGIIATESVIDPLSKKEKVYVTWEYAWRGDQTREALVESLVSEAEVLEAESIMEKEFEAVRIKINEKMGTAIAALNEAQVLAEAAGFDVRTMYSGSYSFKRAISAAGWSGSSMSC
jgi:hypothetical protein